MAGRWELTDEQWELAEPILRPARRKDHRGRPWHETRAVLNGVLWILGIGAQWAEMPAKYPPYQTCHRWFQQWVGEGIQGEWGRIEEITSTYIVVKLRDERRLAVPLSFVIEEPCEN